MQNGVASFVVYGNRDCFQVYSNFFWVSGQEECNCLLSTGVAPLAHAAEGVFRLALNEWECVTFAGASEVLENEYFQPIELGSTTECSHRHRSHARISWKVSVSGEVKNKIPNNDNLWVITAQPSIWFFSSFYFIFFCTNRFFCFGNDSALNFTISSIHKHLYELNWWKTNE